MLNKPILPQHIRVKCTSNRISGCKIFRGINSPFCTTFGNRFGLKIYVPIKSSNNVNMREQREINVRDIVRDNNGHATLVVLKTTPSLGLVVWLFFVECRGELSHPLHRGASYERYGKVISFNACVCNWVATSYFSSGDRIFKNLFCYLNLLILNIS